MYYGKTQLDDFIGLDDFGWLGAAKVKTSCSGKQVLINGKCYAPNSAVVKQAKVKTSCSGKQVLINGKCYAPNSAVVKQANAAAAVLSTAQSQVFQAPVFQTPQIRGV